MPSFALAPLTFLACPPPELVTLAAGAGYDHVGLRVLPASPGGLAHPLASDPALLRETLARMAATGVGVFDLEVIRIGPGFRLADCTALLELGEALGARAVVVAGDDPDESRLAAGFAAVCEAARPFGLTADLEFMPWTCVPTARAALRIVEAAAEPNGGVLVDPLHVARSATTLADIAAIPAGRLHYAQICDAPAAAPATVEGLILAARSERLLPGEGDIDLAGLFRILPAGLPVSVEVPTTSRAHLGREAWAHAALAAARSAVAPR
ncbi:sugar phosphate isomerase/epimerase family protein [Labrys wisconsinensis]|uniref:Sugar phosphate isomerase/epimerase n=1 Tax=Labrys wisconsinensis TaxID=425677 RepID=A0ABU0J0A7_9HYPH|nr:sugar phosphate isomerase/epimerase [Labrys wisconsinensis]MDQ0467692.1 sugar phosphate isomerase/epimerase [Labrys wisconsinensis]